MMKRRNEVDEERKEKKPIIREILEYIIWFAAVVIAVQVITRYIGVFSVVDGESMEPTLYNGEYLWVDKLDYHLSEPERFDVVIFPVEYGEETRHFVKRVIGLPTETVYIDEAGTIYINGEVLKENYGKEVIIDPGRAYEPVTLGEDEYFVMGDNRNNSSDSRDPVVGNIHRDEFIGKAWMRIWPLGSMGMIKHQ